MRKNYASIFYKPVKEEKMIAAIKEQRKRDESLLSALERRSERISSRLAEIDKHLISVPVQSSESGIYSFQL